MNRNGNVPAVERRAAITGVAACSCLGKTDAFLDALLAGKSGIRPISTFDTSDLHSRCAAELVDFDPASFISPMKLRRMDEVGALAAVTTRLALESAGLPTLETGYDDVGVVLGTSTCGVHATGEFLDRLLEQGPAGAPALLFSNTVGNAAASVVALEEKLRGPNTTLSYKEASGLAAVAFAVDLVRAGKAGALVTGGAEDIYDLYFKELALINARVAKSEDYPASIGLVERGQVRLEPLVSDVQPLDDLKAAIGMLGSDSGARMKIILEHGRN